MNSELGIEQKAEAFPFIFTAALKLSGNYIDHGFKSRYQIEIYIVQYI